MDRHSHVGFMCLVVVAQALVQVPAARGQQGYPPGYRVPSAVRSDQPDAIVLSAIRANPYTAPYPITAAWRNGAVVLAGRVGTSVIHDMAVRTVIDLGYPVRDDLVIDTAEAHRVALAQAVGGPWSSPAAGLLVGSAPVFRLSAATLRSPGRSLLWLRTPAGQLSALGDVRQPGLQSPSGGYGPGHRARCAGAGSNRFPGSVRNRPATASAS